MSEKMTKRTLDALERVFSAEIQDRLPFQSKGKIFAELADQGFLQPMERVVGAGWSSVTIRGYQLTHLGRLSYCMNCDGDEEP